jgi:phosphoglycerate dehydrogenase-like enzyme
MAERVNVTLAMPVGDALQALICGVDPRLNVIALTRAQRRVYRGGRPLWAGYAEPAAPDDESEDEATRTLGPVLGETEVLLSNPVVPDDIARRAPKLRWIQLTSAGADRLLEAPVMHSPVKVATASGIHAVPISEYVIGAMLAFAKGFPRAFRAQMEGTWRPYWPEELADKTVAVIGVGAIGGRVARIAKALEMRVLAVRRSADQRLAGAATGDPSVDELIPPGDLHYALAESDYLVLAVPLTPETRGMIGEAELRAMKPSAVIVNIARGPVIDEAQLVRALKDGWIAGAALDVFSQEPLPPQSELWSLPNVILTPHISGGTPRYMERAIDLFCDNLRRYLAREPLRNVVDPERGY